MRNIAKYTTPGFSTGETVRAITKPINPDVNARIMWGLRIMKWSAEKAVIKVTTQAQK